MDKFQNKYRIPTNMLLGFDYGSNAFYFVTICTKNKEHYFGEIISNNVATHNNASIENLNQIYKTHCYASPINKIHNFKETHSYASLQMTKIGKLHIIIG